MYSTYAFTNARPASTSDFSKCFCLTACSKCVRTPRATSSLAVRVAIITALAIAIFSVIFLRLWYLEVLSGDKYLDLANDNRVREIRVQAPRGEVLDRDGKVLVANRTDLALQVQPHDLPRPGPERVP